MTQEARISSRIDADLKREGDAILSEIGLKPSQAIALFYKQIVRQRGIPFDLRLPNETLTAAMTEAREPNFKAETTSYGSAREMLDDLDT